MVVEIINDYKKRLFSVQQGLKRDEFPSKKTIWWLIESFEETLRSLQGSEHLLKSALTEIEELKTQLKNDREKLKESLTQILG